MSASGAPSRPEADVVADGAVEQGGALRQPGYVRIQLLPPDVPDLSPLEKHRASPRRREGQQQLEDGGLSAAAGTDQREAFPARQQEAEAVEDRPLGIGEADVPELDARASALARGRGGRRSRGGG